ncbi:MAG: hypothetical protein WAW37_04075 [Syntrophobacteraceae bacterium]
MQLDDLDLSITESPGRGVVDGGYILNFSRRGRSVYTGECAFRVYDPLIVSDVPEPGCRSLLAYCFSGGAHCCMSLVIATACGAQQSLSQIDLTHSGSEVKFLGVGPKGAKALKVTDWGFAYYSPDETDLQLSFADSPGMSRLVVFEGGRWRVDRIGEFGRFYEPLFREAKHTVRLASRKENNAELEAGRAIRAAYYCFMSGKPAEEASEELKRLLPRTWKPEAEKIFEDIKRSASQFNPVEIIEPPGAVKSEQ